MGYHIESERLILREFTEEDLPRLAEIAAQPHIGDTLSDWRNCDVHEDGWFERVREGYRAGDPKAQSIILAITEKQNGRLIGQIHIGCEYPDFLPGELTIGYFIAEEAQGNRYATEALCAMADYFFHRGHYDFIMALIRPDNLASIKVVQKSGFRLVNELSVPGREAGRTDVYRYYRMAYPM